MKRLLFLAVGATILFASNDDINKKLDLLLQKIEQLEKKIDSKDEEIKKLKKEIKQNKQEVEKQVKTQLAIKSCKKIKVVNLKYEYHDEVIPYYDIEVTLKNEYPKKVVYLILIGCILFRI